MKELYNALAEFRSNVKIEKNGLNPFYNNSKYYTIEDLLSGLRQASEYGIGWGQHFDGGDLITTIYHTESGQTINSVVHIGDYTDAQKWGAAVTYKRRISLITMFGLSEPDHDANETVKTPVDQSPSQVDYGYSGAPYRILKADGSVSAQFSDVKGYGSALKKKAETNKSKKWSDLNSKEIDRIIGETDAGVLYDALVGLKTVVNNV